MTQALMEKELFMFWKLSGDAAAARQSGEPEALQEADDEFAPHELLTEWPGVRCAIRRERLRLVAAQCGRLRA